MIRDSFVFYRSFYDAAQDLEDGDRLKLYDAVIEYALNGAEALTERSTARAIFKVIRPQIDANNKRYENGKKGGRPKTKTKPNKNQNKTKDKRNVNENENVNVNANDIKRAKFNNAPTRDYDMGELELSLLATN